MYRAAAKSLTRLTFSSCRHLCTTRWNMTLSVSPSRKPERLCSSKHIVSLGKDGTLLICLTSIICLAPAPVKSFRTGLSGEVTLASQAPSSSWHAFYVILVDQQQTVKYALCLIEGKMACRSQSLCIRRQKLFSPQRWSMNSQLSYRRFCRYCNSTCICCHSRSRKDMLTQTSVCCTTEDA